VYFAIEVHHFCARLSLRQRVPELLRALRVQHLQVERETVCETQWIVDFECITMHPRLRQRVPHLLRVFWVQHLRGV